MTRHRQWEPRLLALIEKHRSTPYEWGKWDCLLFAAAVAKAVTGKDHARGHRGKYNSFASAYVYLNGLGFDSPAALLDSLFEPKPPGFAHRGDLVTAADGLPMVCMGGFALGVGQDGDSEGLVRVERADWAKAWAV